MTTDDVIEVLGGWEGYCIEKMGVHEEGGKAGVEAPELEESIDYLRGLAQMCTGRAAARGTFVIA